MRHPLFVDLIFHRIACFVGARPKSSPFGLVCGYTSVLCGISKNALAFLSTRRLRLEMHIAGMATHAGTWRAHEELTMPHEQWRRYTDTTGKIRWVWEEVDWGAYDSDEETMEYRGHINSCMFDY